MRDDQCEDHERGQCTVWLIRWLRMLQVSARRYGHIFATVYSYSEFLGVCTEPVASPCSTHMALVRTSLALGFHWSLVQLLSSTKREPCGGTAAA